MEYRRLKHRPGPVWHFASACQHWRRMTANPGSYLSVELEGRPTYGDLCNECRRAESRDKARREFS